MSKLNNKSMNFGFKIMAILAFSLLILPMQANAQRAGYVTPYNSTSFNNYQYSNQNYYQPYQPVTYFTPQTTPTVYSYSTNPNRTSSATTPKASTANTNTGSQNTSATNSATNPDSVSGLAATAIYGSNNFLPSGIIQWVLIAILVLLLVIVARRVWGARQNYDASPMKHA